MKREWTVTEISTTRKLEATDGQENELNGTEKRGWKNTKLELRTHARIHTVREYPL